MLQCQRKNSQIHSSKGSGKHNWVIVSLSSTGERETDLGAIKKSIKRILKNEDIEIFIPAISQTVRGESETMFYMQGYVFIQYEEGIPYLRLRETLYFNDVLCKFLNRRNIKYDLLSHLEIKKIQKKVNSLKFYGFREGDTVKVIKGKFKDLQGEISCVYDDEKVQVSVVLRSKLLLVDYPCTYLMRL